jgi:hypothetical protein
VLALAVALLAMPACRKPSHKVSLTKQFQCKNCSRPLGELKDTVTILGSSAGDVARSLKQTGISGFSARAIASGLARGRTDFTKVIAIKYCDSCSQIEVQVKTIRSWVCDVCGGTYRTRSGTERVRLPRVPKSRLVSTQRSGTCAFCQKLGKGMSKAQVRAALGRPSKAHQYPEGLERWDYYNQDKYVSFDCGRVISWGRLDGLRE